MRISAKVVHRYDCSKNVRVVLIDAEDEANAYTAEFVGSASFAERFVAELNRLNAVDEAITTKNAKFLNAANLECAAVNCATGKCLA